MRKCNNIDLELIEDLYNDQGGFEKIHKGNGTGRIDSKRLGTKGERKEAKEERNRKKNGKWNLVEFLGLEMV